MKRIALIGFVLVGLTAGWVLAQDTAQQPSSTDSLADYARKLREQQQKSNQTTKPAKVFTNDDVNQLGGSAGVSVASAPLASETKTSASGAHDKKYFQKEYAKLLARKEVHERELGVLEQKLAQANIQWYPDPNKELEQESTPKARSDINKLEADINAKKLEIENDDKAISDFQDQMRREGGQPGWLREPLPSVEESLTENEPPETKLEKGDKKGNKEYWQARFRTARTNLKNAEEVQKLAQDEVDLLQKRKLAELAPDKQTEIDTQLTVKQADLSAATAATEKVRKDLGGLQKEFDASEAPQEWSVTD